MSSPRRLPSPPAPNSPERACARSRRFRSAHKVATAAIAAGDPVRKYNQIIGFASRPVAAGDHVHTHNVEVRTFTRDYGYGSEARPTDFVPEGEHASFRGIVRGDGRVATRNYIGLVSSVNCSATVCRYIADAFRGDALADFPHVDGVVALTHGSGCGMPGHGYGWEMFQGTIAGYKNHPNFAGIVGGRPRLRGQPDRRHDRPPRLADRRHAGDHDDPGDGGHPQDGQ